MINSSARKTEFQFLSPVSVTLVRRLNQTLPKLIKVNNIFPPNHKCDLHQQFLKLCIESFLEIGMLCKIVLRQSATQVQLQAVECFVFPQISAVYINFSQIPYIRLLTGGMQNFISWVISVWFMCSFQLHKVPTLRTVKMRRSVSRCKINPNFPMLYVSNKKVRLFFFLPKYSGLQYFDQTELLTVVPQTVTSGIPEMLGQLTTSGDMAEIRNKEGRDANQTDWKTVKSCDFECF